MRIGASLFIASSILHAQAPESKRFEIPTILQRANPENPSDPTMRLLWQTRPGVRYDFRRSENIHGWLPITGYPKEADGPVMFHDFSPADGPEMFFRAELIDEQGPELVSRYPAADAIGVPRFEDFLIVLDDVSAIDPLSIRLQIGATPLSLNSPGVSFVDNVLSYDATDFAHGASGATINILLEVADIHGNPSEYAWSITLQEQAEMLVNDLFVFGSPDAARAGQRLSPRQQRVARAISGPVAVRANDGAAFELLEVHPDTVLIGYDQNPPTFGQFICNLAPTTPEEIFYRRILSQTHDAAARRITLHTEDIELTALAAGSLSLSSQSIPYEMGEDGFLQPALSLDKKVSFGKLTLPLQDMVNVEYSLENSSGSKVASIKPRELAFSFEPSLSVAFSTRWLSLEDFKATMESSVDFRAVFDAQISLPVARINKDIYTLPSSMRPGKYIYLGQLGVVPVYAKLDIGFDLTAAVEANVAGTATLGLRRSLTFGATVDYTKGSAIESGHYWRPGSNDPVHSLPNVSGNLFAEVAASPNVRFIVYNLAGAEASLSPKAGLHFSGSVSQPTRADLELSLDLGIKPTGPSFLELPTWMTPVYSRTLWQKNFNLLNNGERLHTHVVTNPPGLPSFLERVLLPGLFSPQGLFTYGGLPIPGSGAPSFQLPPGNFTQNFGSTVTATENGVPITVISAPVPPPLPPAPSGFALIPGGTFTMGRTSGDTDSDAPPVNVHVSTFYMAKYEVTKALWDEVRIWAANNQYTDLPVGGGKAANHPVHTVSWWDVVKWCNARSEKEGFTAVYRNADGTVFKTDTRAPTANWSANGYRLPTEAEWEKAARGGVSGQRFPWGDTINHSHANYQANGSTYTYDTSPYTTGAYHPTYATGSTPYTSPVGSFAPNGYGLFDMAGNVREWNWDWYSASTYTEGASDPKGPASGSARVLRGGSWVYDAFYCRSAYRISFHPGSRNFINGFRPARSSVP